MKAKEFFKSTSFRCIATLLAIVLVCGIFLTFCHALFEVTDQERFDRAIAQIYGGPVETESLSFTDEQASVGDATVISAYKVKTDGNYLLQVQGLKGYQGGTVTCWVVVKMSDGAVSGIGNVVIASADDSQSWVHNNDSYLGKFAENFKADSDFEVIKTGATGSFTAITNAVNGAMNFVKSVVLGQTIETATPYDDFAYTDYIDKKKTTHSVTDGVVTYNIVTMANGNATAFEIDVSVSAENVITAYTITKNGSTSGWEENMFTQGKYFVGKTKDEILTYMDGTLGEDGKYTAVDSGDIHSGATQSNFLCAYAALFATANYTKALEASFAYTDYIQSATYTVDEGVVTYNIVAGGNGLIPSGFEITVKVGADKTITEYTVVKDGSTNATYAEKVYDYSTYMQGKSTDDILALFGDKEVAWGSLTGLATDDITLQSGATMSNFTCIYAALYATANYDLALLIGGDIDE